MRSYFLYVFAGLFMAVVVVLFAWIGLDATYFLPLSREIALGKVPYVDFYCMYTPLVFYIFGAVYAFVPLAGYKILLAVQVAFIAFASGVFFQILSRWQVAGSRFWQPSLTLLFFIAILASDGHYIMLEPFVVVCILLATFYMLRQGAASALYCGVFIALAFYCKQFGIAALAPVGLYYIMKGEYKRLGMALAGLAATLAAGVLFFLIKGGTLSPILHQWWPSAYAGMDTSAIFSWKTFVLGGKVAWLFLIFPVILFRGKSFFNPFVLYACSGFLIFLIPALFRHFPHYFILCLPYLFLCIGAFPPPSWSSAKLILVVQAFMLTGILGARYYKYAAGYQVQKANAAIVAEKLPHGSSVFITGETYLLVINQYTNPLLGKLGYRWMRNNEKVKDKLPPGSILLPVQQDATDSVLLANGEVLRWYRKP